MPKITGNHQKPGEGYEIDPSPGPQRGSNFADIIILAFWPPELWDNTFPLT